MSLKPRWIPVLGFMAAEKTVGRDADVKTKAKRTVAPIPLPGRKTQLKVTNLNNQTYV